MTRVLVALMVVAMTAISVAAQDLLRRDDFSAKDPSEKRQLLRSLASRADEPVADVARLLAVGLADRDAQVRFAASSALGQIVMRAKARRVGDVRSGDLGSSSELRDALMAALSDPDHRIRGRALQTLEAFGQLKASLHVVLGMWSAESSTFVRGIILDALSLAGFKSADVQALFVAALDDSDERVRRRAAIAVGRTLPRGGLTRVVEKILLPDSKGEVDELIYAIESYGGEARPYISVLDQLRTVAESAERREHVDSAIRRIEGSAR